MTWWSLLNKDIALVDNQFLKDYWIKIKTLDDQLNNNTYNVETPPCLSKAGTTQLYKQMLMSRYVGAFLASLTQSILSQLNADAANVRAKALKSLASIIDVDPILLNDEDVVFVIRGRFRDISINVREAAVDLVGNHIVKQPEIFSS
jgi:hypothetical protein